MADNGRDRAAGPALEIEGAAHRYGRVPVLDDVDLVVEAGEIVCIVGPSGCGKTTLLRLVAGLEELQRGRIVLSGRVVAEAGGIHVPPEDRDIGMVFQESALFPHLDVSGNVGFGLHGGRPEENREKTRRALSLVGMECRGDDYPHTLSGGQQQRVALARALAPGPGIMLLDEPFSGLDARLREQVRDDTLHILKDSGAACLIVTHDGEEAMFLGDRIAVMQDGRILQTGSPSEIYCHPASAFVAAFFSDVNRIAGRVVGGAVDTPLGRIVARGIPEGSAVEVLVRPEALMLHPVGIHAGWGGTQRPGGGYPASVVATRMLGRSSLIHLSIDGADGMPLHLHARMPGQVLPPEGETVGVDLDFSQVFVFPADPGPAAGR